MEVPESGKDQAKVFALVLFFFFFFPCFGNPEREITRGIGTESLGRRSQAFPSFDKHEISPINETDEQGDELQDQAIMLELDNSVEESAEDEAEHPASQGKKTAQHFC